MAVPLIKAFLPNRAIPLWVWFGPFRGARIVMNPRHSLRKILGLYEPELNSWIETALRRVTRVIDVGANDGYFAFGCAAAFHRLGKRGSIVAVEPQKQHVHDLRASILRQAGKAVEIQIIEAMAGREAGPNQVTLDQLAGSFGLEQLRQNTLIKIDVEGAELDVVAGAETWLHPGNHFLIEVHESAFVSALLETFAAHCVPLRQIHQRPLSLLGRESREPDNCWLVSELAAP